MDHFREFFMVQVTENPAVRRLILQRYERRSVLVGPCHHGMARPQVADRGTASDKEGSCE